MQIHRHERSHTVFWSLMASIDVRMNDHTSSTEPKAKQRLRRMNSSHWWTDLRIGINYYYWNLSFGFDFDLVGNKSHLFFTLQLTNFGCTFANRFSLCWEVKITIAKEWICIAELYIDTLRNHFNSKVSMQWNVKRSKQKHSRSLANTLPIQVKFIHWKQMALRWKSALAIKFSLFGLRKAASTAQL